MLRNRRGRTSGNDRTCKLRKSIERKGGKLDRKEFDSAFKAILPDQKLAKVDGEWQLQQGKGEGEEEERDLAAFLEEQFAAGDGDGSGYLSFDEFCAWIAAYHHELARDKTNPGMS